MDLPVALLIFNRPDTTRQVFEAVRAVRPSRLLVIADGPRAAKTGEDARCQQTRAVIDVDWPCEVLTCFSDTNLGCRRRVASGLDWVFQNVERAIILEDDCVPHPSFFSLCEELLERFKKEARVLSINGTNNQFGRRRTEASYYFSRHQLIWGWATWRRAWKLYDVNMPDWPELKRSGFLETVLHTGRAVRSYSESLDRVFDGRLNTWDYQWQLTCWKHGGLAVHPRENLVRNIGFGADATHTLGTSHPHADLPTPGLEFPLVHPGQIEPNIPSERLCQNQVAPPLAARIVGRIKRLCHANRS